MTLRWAVVPFVFFVDRVSKIWVLSRLREGVSLPVWKGVFHLTGVNNTGAAFGMWKEFPAFPVMITAISAIAIFFYLVRLRKEKPLIYFLGWSLVLGGALGNLYDRIRYGHVIDFLDFRIWPVFNIADACICVGVFCVLWSVFRTHASHSI